MANNSRLLFCLVLIKNNRRGAGLLAWARTCARAGLVYAGRGAGVDGRGAVAGDCLVLIKKATRGEWGRARLHMAVLVITNRRGAGTAGGAS